MKIYIITGSDGKIVATIRSTTESKGELSIIAPLPLSGQKVHEIELPKQLEQVSDPKQLHGQLTQLIQDKANQDEDLVS